VYHRASAWSQNKQKQKQKQKQKKSKTGRKSSFPLIQLSKKKRVAVAFATSSFPCVLANVPSAWCNVEGGPFVQSLAIVHARQRRRNHHPTNHLTTTIAPHEITPWETMQRTSVKLFCGRSNAYIACEESGTLALLFSPGVRRPKLF
jgi:hypothetical protein